MTVKVNFYNHSNLRNHADHIFKQKEDATLCIAKRRMAKGQENPVNGQLYRLQLFGITDPLVVASHVVRTCQQETNQVNRLRKE